MTTIHSVSRGKPDAEKPHVRFDEGEVASAKPRRGALFGGSTVFCRTGLLMILAMIAAEVFGDPTSRNWIVADGYVDVASNWQDATPPSSGEMAFFSSQNGLSQTVRFPAGGWTDSGIYYRTAGDLSNGYSLTFDAIGSWWLFGAGAYPGNWQVFTMCAGPSGANYPHILEVDIATNTAAKPVFKLTDGAVKLNVDQTAGNTLSLERGSWNFTDPEGEPTANNVVLNFFQATKGPDEKVILRAGSSLKAPTVNMKVGADAAQATFLVEGGAHAIDTFTVGAYKDNYSKTPATLRIEGGLIDIGLLYVGGRTTTDQNHLEVTGGTLRANVLTLGKTGAFGSSGDAGISGMGALFVNNELSVAADTNSVAAITVSDSATMTVSNLNIGVTAGAAATVTLGGSSTSTLRNVYMTGDGKTPAAAQETKLEIKEDAEVFINGYLLPVQTKNGSAEQLSQVIVGGNAKLRMSATTDSGQAAASGGINLGDLNGNNPGQRVILRVKDNALVETAARTTIGHYSVASNVLEVCGNATFRNTNASGLVLGRGKDGRGYLCVRDNAKIELIGHLQLSGDLQWGNNLGAEERVDVFGGSIFSRDGVLSVNGTNAWVNLAGGETSFTRWIITGNAKYQVNDVNWIDHTNTIHVTGGFHVARGYYDTGSIAMDATNSPTRVQIDGGEVRCCGSMIVGRLAASGGYTPVLAVNGGRLSIVQYTNGDSKLFISGGNSSTSGMLAFMGGEIVANTIRGWGGTSTLIADGGTLVALGDPGSDYTISRFTNARLGAQGLTVHVKTGIETAKCDQVFLDLGSDEGLFTKSGKGRLVVSKASQHARTVVSAGRLALNAGIKTFGRRLSIAEGAYVLVNVPAAIGAVDVLTLDAPLTEAELNRVRPVSADGGYDYTFTQTTADGVTTVTCTVTVSTSVALSIDADQTFANAMIVRQGITVAAGKQAVFNGAIDFIDSVILINVGEGATVIFNQPISSPGATVEKVGSGRVIFNSANPSFFGTWRQNGGTFDIVGQSFTEASTTFIFTKDTLAYSGPSVGTNAAMVTVAGSNAQKRVVVKAENDIVFTSGWNSTGGGIVKYGSGSMTIKEGSGTYSLNTGSVAALGKAISSLPANGASPADETIVQNSSTAGAALNILDGAIMIAGAGTNSTIVKCEQGIYIGTGFAQQGVDARLEINGCDFRADGTTRLTAVGYANAVSACSHPLLKLVDSKLTNHRLYLGYSGPSSDLYPTVEVENTTVNTESGFEVGMANDRVHPVMRLMNTSVKQYRAGYALGHRFYRGFDVTLQSGSLLNATWTSNAGSNWHGFQFQNPSWGTIRVESGSTLQTSRFEFLGAGTEALHVELVFDGGTLDVTADASGNALSARTEVKSAYDAFVTTGNGMTINIGTGLVHTFAAPIKGTGDVRKIGAGSLRLSAVVDGGAVSRQEGRFEVAEGMLDLNGAAVEIQNLCGRATVTNGTLSGSLAVDFGATADQVVQVANTVSFGSIRLNVLTLPEVVTVGALVPLARSASDLSAATLSSWRGIFSIDNSGRKYRVVGKKVENGVVYGAVEDASGFIILVR